MAWWKVEGRIFIVTGAGRGIGRAIAVEAARRGAKGIIVNYKSCRSCAEETVEEIRGMGSDAVAVAGDVGRWSDSVRIVYEAVRRYGGVDVLVNNAGILEPRRFRDMSPEDWEDMFRVHVFGSMNMARAVLDHMKKGVIANISSVLGLRPEEEASHYSAAKAALIAWTIALARELAPEIRVFAVAPGGVDTRMARAWGSLDWVGEQVPLGRLARPEEVAKLVLDAVENPYITGDILTISGGLL